MNFALLDSSVYVSVARGDYSEEKIDQLTAGMTVWLSAVVLQELYAGARDENRQFVETLEKNFQGAGLMLVPDLNDWINAGKILSLVAQTHGYEKIGRSRLTNDALIAASASRARIRVITANGRDFSRLAAFCDLSWQLIAF